MCLKFILLPSPLLKLHSTCDAISASLVQFGFKRSVDSSCLKSVHLMTVCHSMVYAAGQFALLPT